jgi:hydrogenase nickel incorporation protein HypA/HybF
MHEISICQGILKTIEAEMEPKDLPNVREIHLKVGVLSNIDGELLKYVFEFVKADTSFEKAALFVEMIDITATCEKCSQSVKVEKYKFVCPTCGAPLSNITEGNELLINKIIVEETSYA